MTPTEKLFSLDPDTRRLVPNPPRTVAGAGPITIDWRRLSPGDSWIAVERHLFANRERAFQLVEPVFIYGEL